MCHNVYTEHTNKIALSSNDDKRLQTFDKITTYPYGPNAFKVCESEMTSKIYMISFDDYANENNTQRNLKWSYHSDHTYRILIIEGSSLSKKSSTELQSKNDDANSETEVPKKKDISSEKRRQIIDELRLV